MKRGVQILLILLSGLTCISQTKSDSIDIDLVGIWKYSFGYLEHTLILHSDNTYEYRIVGDLNNSESQGEWERKGNKLILSSYKQNPSETTIISEYNDTISGVAFTIKDLSGKPIVMAHIKIRNSQFTIDTLIENSNGIFDFPNMKNVQEFEISFVGQKSAGWTGKMNRNYFEIIMAPENENYIFQNNETWRIKGNKLYSPSSRKDNKIFKEKGRVNYYLKEKANFNKSPSKVRSNQLEVMPKRD